jgi:hypothetical protein
VRTDLSGQIKYLSYKRNRVNDEKEVAKEEPFLLLRIDKSVLCLKRASRRRLNNKRGRKKLSQLVDPDAKLCSLCEINPGLGYLRIYRDILCLR